MEELTRFEVVLFSVTPDHHDAVLLWTVHRRTLAPSDLHIGQPSPLAGRNVEQFGRIEGIRPIMTSQHSDTIIVDTDNGSSPPRCRHDGLHFGPLGIPCGCGDTIR